MSKFYKVTIAAAMISLSACGFDGGPVVMSDTDHEIRVGGALTDSEPLTIQVREKLRNNGETALARIKVSSPSADTVRLSGIVDNDAIRREAERMAYQVDGVRFVVNTLELRS